jgi:hypothetical protein
VASIVVALIISAITELGIVLTHVWASPPHDHPSQEPWWPNSKRLKKWNDYHLASFFGHFPIQGAFFFVLIYTEKVPPWILVPAVIIDKWIWIKVKEAYGKSHWGNTPFT